jgi:phosphate transport system permease protein
MHTTWIFATLAGLSVLAYIAGRRRALAIAGGATGILHSLPTYHGVYVALWCVVPSLLLISLWLSFEPIVANAYLASLLGDSVSGLSAGQRALLLTNVKGAAVGAHAIGELEPSIRAASDTYGLFLSGSRVAMTASVLALSAGGLVWGRRSVSGDLRARNRVESAARILMFAASAIAVLTTIGIVLSLIFEALRFFARVPITEFLFGLKWSPQTALRADQVGASGAFGASPLFVGTLLITFLAMCRRSSCRSTRSRERGPWPSLSWRSWREFRRSCTDFSPHLPLRRCCVRSARIWDLRLPRNPRLPPVRSWE